MTVDQLIDILQMLKVRNKITGDSKVLKSERVEVLEIITKDDDQSEVILK